MREAKPLWDLHLLTFSALSAHFVLIQIDGVLHSGLQMLNLIADCVHILLNLH